MSRSIQKQRSTTWCIPSSNGLSSNGISVLVKICIQRVLALVGGFSILAPARAATYARHAEMASRPRVCYWRSHDDTAEATHIERALEPVMKPFIYGGLLQYESTDMQIGIEVQGLDEKAYVLKCLFGVDSRGAHLNQKHLEEALLRYFGQVEFRAFCDALAIRRGLEGVNGAVTPHA